MYGLSQKNVLWVVLYDIRGRILNLCIIFSPQIEKTSLALHSLCKQPWDHFSWLNKEFMQRHPLRTRCLTHKVLNWNYKDIWVWWMFLLANVLISPSWQWLHFLSNLEEQCLFVVLAHLLAASDSVKQTQCYKKGGRKIQQLLKWAFCVTGYLKPLGVHVYKHSKEKEK